MQPILKDKGQVVKKWRLQVVADTAIDTIYLALIRTAVPRSVTYLEQTFCTRRTVRNNNCAETPWFSALYYCPPFFLLTFYRPRVSVIASPLTTVSHYSGADLPRKRTAYAFERSCTESPVRLCPAVIIPDRPVPLSAQSCTKKDGGSHLCFYNSVICLDNCVFL